MLDEHSAPPDVLLMSTHTWQQLSDQEKAWIDEAVAASVTYQRQLWHEVTENALSAVTAAGVTVVRPQKDAFFESVAPIYRDLEGS